MFTAIMKLFSKRSSIRFAFVFHLSINFFPIQEFQSSRDPHDELADILQKFALEMEDGSAEAQSIQAAASKIAEIGSQHAKFYKAAKDQVARLRHWCKGKDGGYRQLRNEIDSAEEARDRLIAATKRKTANETVREEFRQRKRNVELLLEECYSDAVSYPLLLKGMICLILEI